jgi:hypothetical protein
VEVEWKWLLLPDPADYHLPKASANALPVPASRKAKDELNAKRAADDTPRKDAPFVEGLTWAEFNTCTEAECTNDAQARLDLKKDNQIWFYLGQSSTETKAQYTEDPSHPQHNPKGNFLDTIPKPPKPAKPSQAAQKRHSSTGSQLQQNTPSVGSGRPEKPYVYKPRKPMVNPDGTLRISTSVIPLPRIPSMPSLQGQQLNFGPDPQFQSPITEQNTPKLDLATNPPHNSVPTTASTVNTSLPYSFVPWKPQQASAPPRRSLISASEQATPSIYQKYPFFGVNHNR